MDTKNAAASTDFKDLLQEYGVSLPKVGDMIEGTVVNVGKSEVQVDINGIATGVVRGFELVDESGEYSDLSVGDTVLATVLDLENEHGSIELSFRSAGHKKAWDSLTVLMKSGEVIGAKIGEANKGGLMVTVGKIQGFLPVSQLSPEHYPRIQGGDKNKILERLKTYVGDTFEVKIIDINDEEEKLIVSEKAVWEEKQRDVISSYKVGDTVEGAVTVITDFGVFVEFGEGLEGLVHISELAWQRIEDPHDIVKRGQVIKAEIIKIEGSKIFLSMKKLIKDPWSGVTERYSVGMRVKGKVLKINSFGLFVELDPDIHGLAHISELSNKSISDPHDIAKIGDVLDFAIVSIKPEEHRLGLSIKALSQSAKAGGEKAATEKSAEEKAAKAPVEARKETIEEKPVAEEAPEKTTDTAPAE